MTVRLTDHALTRAAERHGWTPREAHNLLRRAATDGVLIPERVRHRFSPSYHAATDHSARLRIWGPVAVVVRSRLVITTWRLTIEELADLVVWAAIGIWPEGGQ